MQNFVLIICSYYAKIVRRHPRALAAIFKHVVFVMFQYTFLAFYQKLHNSAMVNATNLKLWHNRGGHVSAQPNLNMFGPGLMTKLKSLSGGKLIVGVEIRPRNHLNHDLRPRLPSVDMFLCLQL